MVKRYEVYWVDLDPKGKGTIAKQRPCVIISPNELNQRGPHMIIPCSSKSFGLPFHVPISGLSKPSWALIEHMGTIDRKRIKKRIKVLSVQEKQSLVRAIATYFKP